jgi:hypothetical protein
MCQTPVPDPGHRLLQADDDRPQLFEGQHALVLRVRRRLDVLDDAPRRVLLFGLIVKAREPALGEFSRLERALLGDVLQFRLRELLGRLLGLRQLRLAETHEAHELFNTHAARAVLVEPSP